MVKISIYDEDLVGSDFMGYHEITIQSEEDLVVDAWFDLVARPGKNDKGVAGKIHLLWTAHYMKNFTINPAAEWPDYSLISIEPQPYYNVIEVQVRVSQIHPVCLFEVKWLKLIHFRAQLMIWCYYSAWATARFVGCP